MRMKRKGSTDDTRKNVRPMCSVDGCEQPHVGNGLCRKHYMRSYAREKSATERAESPHVCERCGVVFFPVRYKTDRSRFCSRACKEKARTASGRAAVDVRKSYFKTRYGLTVEQVEEMAEAGCGICGTTEWMGRHNRPHVDHDHKTGKVRGILCSECNTGLGKFKDDPALTQAATAYLERTSA